MCNLQVSNLNNDTSPFGSTRLSSMSTKIANTGIKINRISGRGRGPVFLRYAELLSPGLLVVDYRVAPCATAKAKATRGRKTVLSRDLCLGRMLFQRTHRSILFLRNNDYC